MKYLLFIILFIFHFSDTVQGQKVLSIKIDGAINPSTADFIHNGIIKAQEENAECLIIHLNTPGGLLKSTRVIVGEILESPIPVIVYVAPGGAHAGSAGVFITMAAHIAVMAPGTNIGAAHPVGMQGSVPDTIMNEKTTNDAAAFIRAIAGKRRRNLEWAEEAVRKSVSITESEALENNVINYIASSERELLNIVHGKSVELGSRRQTLNTAEAEVVQMEMSFWDKLLDKLSDPNIAYILMMIGFYGILFELYNPGAMFPGIIGVISLILAFYSMHALPVNLAGIALIVFALILFLLEIKITSYGLLTIGGVISLFLGSVMLFRSESSLEFIRISMSVIVASTVITALFFIAIIGIGLKAQKLALVTGVEGLIGETGVTINELVPAGLIKLHGEIWNAESVSGSIQGNTKVTVKEVRNLTLMVDRYSDSPVQTLANTPQFS